MIRLVIKGHVGADVADIHTIGLVLLARSHYIIHCFLDSGPKMDYEATSG